MVSAQALQRYPFFASASPGSLETLAAHTEELTVERGELLFEDGDPAERMYILIQGEVDIGFRFHDGDQGIVDTRVSGDLIGWHALVEPYRTTARALVRSTATMLAIDAMRLREVCDEDREFGYMLLKEIARVGSDRLALARGRLVTTH